MKTVIADLKDRKKRINHQISLTQQSAVNHQKNLDEVTAQLDGYEQTVKGIDHTLSILEKLDGE